MTDTTTPNTPAPTLTQPGRFFVGCNYWASHAGAAMWSNWNEETVRRDLEQLAAAGLQVLRVFPLWSDFQPIAQLFGGGGQKVEVRHGEDPLPHDEAGRAGLSRVALERFATFADLADRAGLRLIVGLVTGWMSGRLFVPPALEGLNVLTDPAAIRWEVRLVRAFVRRFRAHPAILAWDLGNECNCMAPVRNADEAWTWTSQIVGAIRTEDPARPVVSGMHGLGPNPSAKWRIQDQAEILDVLTIHPYPVFTPHCDNDPINTIRSGLHATAESLFYGDIGARPCFAEEIGTIGPMVCDDAVAADYARTALFSLWAHDCRGMVWWCAYDQDRLAAPPYDWCALERELGLIRADRAAKPVLAEMMRFAALLRRLPFRALPPRLTQGVCILSEDQDQWGAAYSSFVLAKQAQLDIVFQYADQSLRDSGLYLLPAVSGMKTLSRRFWLELLDRVDKGATLYVSFDGGFLSPFGEPFGLDIVTRELRTSPARLKFEGLEGAPEFSVGGRLRLTLRATRAAVLGREEDGNPAFTCAEYGRGRIFFLAVPLETELSRSPGCFHRDDAPPYWKIYRHLAEPHLADRVARCFHPSVGATEHPLSDAERLLVLINYGPQPVRVPVALASVWAATETFYGPGLSDGHCALGANDASVLAVVRRNGGA